ncbi:MAG TPA: AI-2E family transporter [Gemmatimonadales bacterium]|nr:AI-2E family transporter [Gemmatimonadales bacterium]
MTHARTTAISAAIVAAVAVGFVLYVGRVVFIPIALALVLAAVLAPVVGRLEKARIPAPVGSALLLLGTLALVTGAGLALADPVRDWAHKAPEAIAAAGKKVQAFRHRFDRLGALMTPRQGAPSGADSSHSSASADSSRDTSHADRAQPSPSSASPGPSLTPFLGRAFGTTTEIISQLTETVLLLFFLLAGGRSWQKRITQVAESAAAGKKVVGILGEMQQVVSRYLLVTLLINIGQGILVGIAMALIGMPAPVVWGLMTLVAEFVPYAGGLVMVVLLGLVGLAGSTSAGHVLLAPGLYLLITTLQNNLVSPVVYGEGLRLNPIAILLGVILWYFLWGVPGAFLAVPILAAFKIVCERVETLKPVGVFLEH